MAKKTKGVKRAKVYGEKRKRKSKVREATRYARGRKDRVTTRSI